MTARVTIPALVRGDELINRDRALLGRFTQHAADIEASDGGLSAGMFISNPFTDVPELQTSVFVDDRWRPRASRPARRSPRPTGFWEVHERMQQPLVSLDEAASDRRRDDTRGRSS